jgi:hypothetical protein
MRRRRRISHKERDVLAPPPALPITPEQLRRKRIDFQKSGPYGASSDGTIGIGSGRNHLLNSDLKKNTDPSKFAILDRMPIRLPNGTGGGGRTTKWGRSGSMVISIFITLRSPTRRPLPPFYQPFQLREITFDQHLHRHHEDIEGKRAEESIRLRLEGEREERFLARGLERYR